MENYLIVDFFNCVLKSSFYSDDSEERVFVSCLNLLEEEELCHRLISVVVET